MRLNMSPDELQKLRSFVERYNINDVSTEQLQTRRSMPVRWSDYTYNPDMYFQEEVINMVKMTLPEQSLTRIIDIVNEFDVLMRDPETAKLVMEARFINRLKYGSKI